MKVHSLIKNKPKRFFLLYRALKFVMLFQLIFGYYYDAIDTKLIFFKYLIKLTCLMLALLVSIGIIVLGNLSHLNYIDTAWHYIYIIEYLLTVFIILVAKPTFGKFYKRYNDVDDKLKFPRKYYISLILKTIIGGTVTTSLRSLHGYYFCLWFPDKNIQPPSLINIILSLHPLLALDMLRIKITAIFITTYERLKILREKIEDKYGDKKVKSYPDAFDAKNDVKFFEDIYKEIADNVSFIKPTIDALVRHLCIVYFKTIYFFL